MHPFIDLDTAVGEFCAEDSRGFSARDMSVQIANIMVHFNP